MRTRLERAWRRDRNRWRGNAPSQSLRPAKPPLQRHKTLSDGRVHADELYHYFRFHTIRFFSSRQRHVGVARVVNAIETRLDSRLEAFDEHCARTIARQPG